jgi:dihydroorotate dehydrogenase (NAD+) catalytic subunit
LTDTAIKIGKIVFTNPVFTASGTFGYGLENSELVNINTLGAIVTKSITLNPREGNPPPRIVETSAGMINSIGLANVGVKTFVSDYIPEYSAFDTQVIVNIAGTTEAEYIEVLKYIESVSSDIAGYEINISCPNVDKGGMEFGVNRELTAQLTGKLRKLTERLLIMKLSPNVTDISQIGESAQNAGADAVSAINTLVGMSIDSQSRKSRIYTTFGGLSGPAIKPVGLAAVFKLYKKLSIPIIGIGGIVNATDVVEYLLAGAKAVQVGTANFRDANIGNQIISDLSRYLNENNIDKIEDLTGAAEVYPGSKN